MSHQTIFALRAIIIHDFTPKSSFLKAVFSIASISVFLSFRFYFFIDKGASLLKTFMSCLPDCGIFLSRLKSRMFFAVRDLP